MSEHEKFEGRISLRTKEAKLLAIRIQGLLMGLRDLADPTLPIADLPGEVIGEQAVLLAALHADYIAKIAEVDNIRKVMGR